MRIYIYYLSLLNLLFLCGCEMVHQFNWETEFDKGKVFVSVERGNDNNEGRRDSPVKSINSGIARALELEYEVVMVEAGVYENSNGGLTGTGTAGILINGKSSIHISGGWINDFSKRGGDEDATLVRDAAAVYGNLISLQNVSNFFLEKLVIANTTSTLTGAGITINASSDIQFSECYFTSNNTTGGNGGGLYVNNSSGITLESCVFYQNTTTIDGGGLYIQSTSGIEITGCMFRENTAAQYGSAITILLNSSDTVIKKSAFIKNQATTAGFNEGGTVYLGNSTSDTFMFEECYFEKNSSSGGCGGIFVESIGTLEINSCYFLYNITTHTNGDGGALRLDTINNLSITDTKFIGNEAIGGGRCSDLYIDTVTNTEVTGCSFVNSELPGSSDSCAVNFHELSSLTFSGNFFNNSQSTDCPDYLVHFEGTLSSNVTMINNFFSARTGTGTAVYTQTPITQPFYFQVNAFSPENLANLYAVAGPVYYNSISNVNNAALIGATVSEGNYLR